jgi:hypothetical protein
MLRILAPVLVAAAIAGGCLVVWTPQPRLQRNSALRLALIVSVLATVGLALVAGVEILGRILAFGLDDPF